MDASPADSKSSMPTSTSPESKLDEIVTDKPVPCSEAAVAPVSSKTTLLSLVVSTITSLSVVVILLVVVRVLLPSTIELTRYAWHRGQLRAEYEMSGSALSHVSEDGLGGVSSTVGRRVLPSVVQILNIRNPSQPESRGLGAWMDWASKLPPTATGHGSGVVLDSEGHIITNAHVLENDTTAYVYLADERLVPGRVLAKDTATDLALVKIDADNLMPISWGNSDLTQVGSPVWAVGSPFGLKGSLTFGIVSSKHRLDLSGTHYDEGRGPIARYSDLMQTDVAVNPGNSGGPLVNARGELVGINTAIVGESYRGVSFAIPSNLVKRIVEDLRSTGGVQRGWLGVEFATNDTFKRLRSKPNSSSNRDVNSITGHAGNSGDSHVDDAPDVSPDRLRPTVQRVLKDSPAFESGLRVGDVLFAIDDITVQRVEDAVFKIGSLTPGTTTVLRVVRDEMEIQIPVNLGKRPE